MMLDTFYSKTLGLVAYNLARLKSLSSNSPRCISASAKTSPKSQPVSENEMRGSNVLFS